MSAATGWDLREIQTSRLRHQYRIQGQADGLPLLLLHGSFASGLWWEPFLSLLPEEIWATAPDLRGCGESDKPGAGYTIEGMAEDVHAFVQGIGWDDFDLVGHAVGGAIAVEYTLRHMDAVHTLTLVDCAPIGGVVTPLEALVLFERMQSDRDLLAEALGLLMPTYDRTVDDGAFFARLVDVAAHMAPAAFTEVAVALGQWNRLPDAKYLTLPTLVIWGDLDQVVGREEATQTLIAIPGANQMEVLRGVGHSPMIEAPLALAEHIIDFITQDFDEYGEIRQTASSPDD